MATILRNLRGFEMPPNSCQTASDLSVDKMVRAISRSLVTVSAYDGAVINYCREFFDRVGNEDISFRHDVCKQLRGPLSFAFLFTVYLDSPSFKASYLKETGVHPNRVREPNVEPTPGCYVELVDEMKVPTLYEEKGRGKKPALNQQARLTARKAKEVDLVEYVAVSRVKTLVHGTDQLHDFFNTWLPAKMDEL